MTDDLDDVPELPAKASNRVLHPLERLAEILFGLIMVLVSTGSLSVVTAGNMEVRTMLVGALGCNLAWGVIDAGLYLMARLHERGRKFLLLEAVHRTTDQDTARTIIADALPPLVTSVLTSEQLESIRQKLSQVPGLAARPRITKRDWIGALGICLLVFLSTF